MTYSLILAQGPDKKSIRRKIQSAVMDEITEYALSCDLQMIRYLNFQRFINDEATIWLQPGMKVRDILLLKSGLNLL